MVKSQKPQEILIKKRIEKDQHFLVDRAVLKKQVEISNLSKQDRIIEIGAGNGVLTRELLKNNPKVLAFEIDVKFKDKLEKIKKENNNLTLVFGNALDYSWLGYNKLVSNIPYSLSEPVILRMIESEITEAVLIVGERFKELLVSPKTKIGIITTLFFDVKPIMLVKKDCFNPVPRVDSWLIKLSRREELSDIDKILQNTIKKQGKLKNSILYALVKSGKTKNQARETIKSLNIVQKILDKNTKKITSRFLMILRERLTKAL